MFDVQVRGEIDALIERVSGIHDKIAADVPPIRRGQVWCRRCGSTRRAGGADALRNGWPKCCGHTMTIDSPAEQAALRARQGSGQ